MRAFLLACALPCVACGPRVVAAPPERSVPVVPVTLEAQYLTTLHCEHRISFVTTGEMSAGQQAAAVDANLVVAFTYTTSKQTTNGVTTVVGTNLTAKAVHCPPDVYDAVLALYRGGTP